MLKHSSVVSSWIEHVFDGDAIHAELVIETSLETRRGSDRFDQALIDGLVEVAFQEMADAGANRVRIVPARPGNA